MHEVSNQLAAETLWAVPVRRLRVTSVGRDDPPSADELRGLVAAVAARRDREAFAALFRHFGPRLKAFFMRGSLSAGMAEDLVQETMLSLWRKASYYDSGKAAVSTWVFTIARNLRIDHGRRQRVPADLPADSMEMPPSVEDELLGVERDLRVRKALAGLSDEQQTIIRLSYYGEKSQSEIAGELGIPLGTVKSRTRLAMNRLRALLEDET